MALICMKLLHYLCTARESVQYQYIRNQDLRVRAINFPNTTLLPSANLYINIKMHLKSPALASYLDHNISTRPIEPRQIHLHPNLYSHHCFSKAESMNSFAAKTGMSSKSIPLGVKVVDSRSSKMFRLHSKNAFSGFGRVANTIRATRYSSGTPHPVRQTRLLIIPSSVIFPHLGHLISSHRNVEDR